MSFINIQMWTKLRENYLKTLKIFAIELLKMNFADKRYYFADDKTPSILFVSKLRAENIPKLIYYYKSCTGLYNCVRWKDARGNSVGWYAINLLSHIFNYAFLVSYQDLSENAKKKCNLCKINAKGFALCEKKFSILSTNLGYLIGCQ